MGIPCDLAILKARERVRGLVHVVHRFCTDDLTLDSGRLGPHACEERVVSALQAG